MSTDPAYVQSHIADARPTAAQMAEKLAPLSQAQLAWKPDAKTWSVGPVIDHLLVSNRTYDGIWRQMAAGTHRKNFWSRVPGLKGMFGKLLRKATHPDNAKPGPTRPVFEPRQADIPADILRQYLAHHELMMQAWESLAKLDLDDSVVISPAGSFVVYSLRDGLEILMQHERRHLGQALRLMQRAGFPKE